MEITKEYLDRLIADQVEESTQLDYKAADSLNRSDSKKREITKDVSALANAAGGVIIYGIREHTDDVRKHLPERLDPVNQSEYSKEWLDQIVGSIQPRITGLKITPVHVGPAISDFCYAVEVPQGDTAHQARDHRYYRRRNFESTPMEDYEVREVMNRRRDPVVTADVRIVMDRLLNGQFTVRLRNTSRVIALHVAAVVRAPLELRSPFGYRPKDAFMETEDGFTFWEFIVRNGKNGPLFPGGEMVFPVKLERTSKWDIGSNESLREIRISVFADQMDRVDLVKDPQLAEADWT